MSEDKITRIDFRPAEQSAYRNAKRNHPDFPYRSYTEFVAAVGNRPSTAHRLKVIDGVYQWMLKATPAKLQYVYEQVPPEQLKAAMLAVSNRSVDYLSVQKADISTVCQEQTKELTRQQMEARIAELKRVLGK